MLVILAGGPSAEREVSFWSAETIGVALKKLDKKFVVIDPAQKDWLALLKASKPILVLIALHGPFGEDGQLQKILEKEGIPFSGSDSRVSALAINKEKAKKMIGGLGIATPKNYRVRSRLPYPVVVKPLTNGSSFGVTVVKDAATLSPALVEAKKFGRLIIEQYIAGTELTCGVIDIFGSIQALPLVEIRPNRQFFDFAAKYDSESGCQEICPAPIDGKLTKEIQELSIKVYKILGCRQYARIDWIVRDGTPYFLEVNTLPGLTKNSLINKELLAAGISFENFIDPLIKKVLF
ncbi:MAG: D-alanine--D-alanine ligase [Candidatus Berkelbacteria bacterium]|nr:D-alanine--D-alanine ligase [Candidatus Berkelbacteria bacterium]MCR4307026.1 D-alanine--D-alanine ligase [Candidatus Berkelbacteria bacterium]